MNLPSAPVLGAFALASLVLAATPGPGVLYIVARTLAQGRTAGLASVAGVALGNLGNALGASLGLAALFALWPPAQLLVRIAGAAYLVWLGVQALRRDALAPAPAGAGAPRRMRLFRDAALVALLNPKTAIFFAAFLPQFIDPAAPAAAQSVLFGSLFVLIAACSDAAYALAAGQVAARWGAAPRVQAFGRCASAATFIGLGLYAAASGALVQR